MTTTTSADVATPGFADLGVERAICDSLAEVGITSPFPIQEMTLPLALTGADIIGQARTGTGKTLGFGLPLLQRIDTAGGLQALVVVPTRELCLQVAEDLAQAGRGKGVQVVALYGGKAMQPQIDALSSGAHLVVGTPGRLLDLSRRGHLDLSGCRALVLDEADEMLDLGFLPDVEQLVEMTAADRQTLLFSATMPSAIVGLARRYMTKPTFMRADVEQVNIAPKTRQFFFSCHRMDKPAVLARILQTPDRGLCVVFCRTKRMADILAEELRERDVAAQAIHSDLRQDSRERVLQRFRDGKVTVLCATEVAARGLDIDDVTHVVNYDCPDDEKMYLHRIGRTGRAGADGVAITFAVWNELPRLEMIRRELDIEDEVHEVFSTSPLLDELFDLPPRDVKPKVANPPQARSGRGSRSRRRGERVEQADGTARDEGAPAEGSSGPVDRPSADEDGEGGDARRRTRRRGRGKGGADAAAEDAPAETPAQRADEAAAAEGDEPAGGRTRTRTRTRRDDRGMAARATEDAEAPAPRTRTRAARPAEERADQREGGRSRSRADGRGDGDRPGRSGRAAGTAGEDGRSKDSRSKDGRSKSGSTKDGRTRDSRDRDGRGRDRDGGGRDRDGSGRDRDGSARDGGRDRGGRDRSGRDRSRDGRSRESRAARTPVDHVTARGEGQPRLKRPLEVQHLP